MMMRIFKVAVVGGCLAVMAGCAVAPAPVAPALIEQPTSKPLPTKSADPGWLLSGKVVTMNDAGEVWDGARLWVKDGAIAAVIRAGDPLPPGADMARPVDTGGVIYPGLIDIHNHPEYAIYPLLPINRKYKDRYEWRNYDDDYVKRISNLHTLITDAKYLNLYPEVGRYGELKALIGGTTSVQGMRTDQPYAQPGCLARNVETANVGPGKVSSRVDIGRDLKEWQDLQTIFAAGPLVVHLAEGAGPRMAREYLSLQNSALVGSNLVAIHGVGLGEKELADLQKNGGKLVWSPLSNFMLYGTTAHIDAARRLGVAISLAPDWAPSGSKSILGELKVADLVNKNRLGNQLSDRELAAMVTRAPAAAIGWEARLGQLAPGYLADLVVLDERNPNPYRNLIEAIEENVRLVWVQGVALYGDSRLMQGLRAASDIEEAGLFANRRPKMVAMNCPALPTTTLPAVKETLQAALSITPELILKRVSPAQLTTDLAACQSKPADPPTLEDARRAMACRFGLPFEKTLLSPFATSDDGDFFPRLLANPNLPPYLKKLPDYYRRQQ